MFKHYKLLTGVLALLLYNGLFAQTIVVNGTVTSKIDGKPLSGVTAIVNGTNKGTKTDNEGRFSIPATANSVITFSFIGFQPQDVTVTSNTTNINISLENA